MKQLFTLILVFSTFAAFAQEPTEYKADNLFKDRAYIEAATMYEILPKNRKVLQNLADCYFFNGIMQKATDAYANLYKEYPADSIPSEYLFKYSHALKGLGQYKKADSLMSVFYKGKRFNTPALIDSLLIVASFDYKPQVLSDGGSGDFGIAYYKDKVVFSSTRNTERPVYSWNGKPYLDLYIAKVGKNGKLDSVQQFSKKINTDQHESSAVFSKDGKTTYFNRTSDKRVKVGEEKFASVRMFKAEYVNGEWTNEVELPFSSDQYNTEHPALSLDEKRLYFSSDMPGSLGSFDLFYVTINEDGTYGLPQNMGKDINTPFREQFPFISKEGILYFVSDGLPGLGGLDIFQATPKDSLFRKPVNLGKTINSGMDDFAYAVDSEKDTGYFSSNREKGVDNLYTFVREDNLNKYVVEGDVVDKKSKQFLTGTKVSLYDTKGNLIDSMTIGSNGHYKFRTKPNTSYKIYAEKNFYIPFESQFTTGEEGVFYYYIELSLESFVDKIPEIKKRNDGAIYIELENIYFDFDKWDIKPQAAKTLDFVVGLLKQYPTMEIEINAHTDSQGTDEYNLHLSSNRAGAAVQYIISKGINKSRLRYNGYGESMPLVPCGDNCSELEHSINRRCEFILTK